MKLPALLLLGSLALNAALLTTLAFRPALLPPAWRDVLPAPDSSRRAATTPPPAPNLAPKNSPAAAPASLWSALETDDLPALVRRLRAAGFPASVIRAIASARLEGRFAARRRALAAEVEDAPFWRPTATSAANTQRFYEQRNQLNRDRSRALRELLGDEFFASTGGDLTAAQRQQYGSLPRSKIDLVARINDDYQEMASQIRALMQGITLPEDRAQLALLEREKRADLAAVLTPPELEDYEMRSSTITSRLRSALTLMNATEDEFRAIYRLQQQYGDPLDAYSGYLPSDYRQQRQEKDRLLTEQLTAALGADRYAQFARSQHQEFQQLARIAQRDQLDPQAAIMAFDLRASTAVESVRIHGDRSLSVDQKLSALRTLAQATKTRITATLGSAGAAYAQSATWLQAIEAGRAVSFEGRFTTYRSLPPPSAPPRP